MQSNNPTENHTTKRTFSIKTVSLRQLNEKKIHGAKMRTGFM